MSFLKSMLSGWNTSNWFSGKQSGWESMIGDSLNGFLGVNAQMDRSYAQQLSSMGLQNTYNNRQWLRQINYEKEMWNLQNQYNSPAAQLARMRDAGIDINPTSYALGTGNLSNTAALLGTDAPMSASGFSGSGSPAGNPISMLMGMASGIQGIRESKARTDNIRVQNDNLRETTDAIALDNAIKRHNLSIGNDLNMPVGQVPSAFGIRLNPGELGSQIINAMPGFKLARHIYDYFSKK